ncbi:Protein of unknown function [Modestobacter sp. DSM 44400]|uniref:septation protein SepH n=1 Tax=Modestobacter sp. DSM 44400 TaxID=1550230 RepID=UPI00089D7267|nr:septation protein SepH [Modestobacter sp. DSM 44400]SDX72640.1 Protein of unknown function [Modestobacter sp. DSM 44400]
MRSLRLVALSDDGKHLVLAPDGPESGDPAERFLVPIDDRLGAAARGDAHRVAQIEIEVGNSLPPRVIQARIRAGETPEQVAHSSGTSVERIMRFAHPVLQERERVADQARDARVRLSEGTPSVPLEQFMSERLRLLGADLDAVRWDAHRNEDGTWQVRAAWRAGHKSGTTRWSFDLPAKTVTPVDATTMDFAEGTRLVRVVPDVPAGIPAADPRRPISVARGGSDPADADAITDADDLVVEEIADAEEGVRNVVPVDGNPVDVLLSGSDVGDDDLATRDTVVLGKLGDGETEDPRARIPAWEDIVFGVRRHR